ncbi:putative ribonuclease H-like domain-containing protein, partial [Tanacetum coccineum]
MGLESLEAMIVVHEKNKAVYEEDIAFLKYDVQVKDISIKDLKNQLEEALKEKDDLKLKLEKIEESSKNLTKLMNTQISAKDKAGLGYDSQINDNEVVHSVFNSRESDVDDSPVNDRFKISKGFHAAPPPYTGNYMPSRPDLSFSGLDDSVYKTKASETETSISKTSKDIIEKPKTIRPSAPIIEDWDTDSDNDSVFTPKSDHTIPKFTKINFVKSDEKVKFVNKENTHRQVEYPRKSQSPRDNRRNWNGMMTQKLGNGFEFVKKACFVRGSFNHLIKDCDFHDKKMVEKPVLNNKGRVTSQREIRPVWNNAQRVNHQNKFTNPHLKKNFVPIAVVTKSGQVPVNIAKQSSPRAAASISIARPVNTAAPKSKGHNVSTIGPKAVVSAAKEKGENDVKSSACWIWRPTGNVIDHTSKDSGSYMLKRFDYVDLQGRLKHMTGNKFYLSDYQDIDGGFVAFGGSPKGGKITRKGKIRTEKLDFEDVYFVKELKFNLFSVSQMYDKKNSVLFTKTKCLVLSPDSKLLDESQVLLKVPRQNNMYSFDLKNVIPSGGVDFLLQGNQTNGDAGIVDNLNARQSTNNKDADEVPGKGDDDLSERNDQERNDSSTHDVNTIRPSINTASENINTGSPSINTASENINTGSSNINTASLVPNDSSMLSLENTGIFDDVYDDREVGAEADLNNLETTMNTLVDLPNGKRAIGTKWVFRNKKDEKGIVVRNKARLVAQGYTQEERIDYDEVFAHVARIEAIRLFLAYASFIGFIVYQMDVKSAFLYGTIEEGVYLCQPPSFEDPQFPDKVYKVEKALYGLHQALRAWYETLSTYLLENGFRRGTIDKNLFIKKDKGELTFFLGLKAKQKDNGIFISQDKYVVDILKKFDFVTVKTASTPIETNKALLKDKEAENMDVHLYISMIGSLMCLTASRPDIMFAVCACARFQVTPKVSHLHAVKRIFRYLKFQPKLGLWYPRDSPFDLVAFLDSDYAGASLDRKSTIGGCQYLGKRLISWQCKKQTIVANSTTEAEYV